RDFHVTGVQTCALPICDILYNGDLQKWRKFANTLMIRILMRQSAKKDVSQQVAEIFNNPDRYPVFSSVDDGATLVYNNSSDYYRSEERRVGKACRVR